MRILISIILVLCVGIGIYAAVQIRSAKVRAEAHAIAHTRMEMQDISVQMHLNASEGGFLPTVTSSAEEIAIGADTLFKWLSTTNENNLKPSPMPQQWLANQKVVDRWGNDIHITVRYVDSGLTTNSTIKRYVVKIWSNGPNGKNDLGKADDVLIEPFEVIVPSAP